MKRLSVFLPLVALAFASRANAAADLLIDHAIAAPNAYVGRTYSFGVAVRNAGPDVGRDVLITMSIPNGVNTVTITTPTLQGSSCAQASGVVRCHVPSMAASTSQTVTMAFSFAVPSNTAEGTTYTSSMTVDEPTDTKLANNSLTRSATVVAAARVTSSAVRIGTSYVPGSRVTYSITVRNPEAWVARNVIVTDEFSGTGVTAGAYYLSRTISGSSAFTCEPLPEKTQPQRSVCTATSMPAGQTATFTFDVLTDPSIPASSNLQHIVSVTCLDMLAAFSLNESVRTTPSADAIVSLTAPANAPSGQDFTITASARSVGPSDGTGARFTISLPASSSFVSMTQSIPAPAVRCTPPAAGSPSPLVDCTIDRLLAPRPSETNPDPLIVSVVLRSSTAGAATTSATLSLTGDPATANNTASSVTNIVAAAVPTDLSVSFVPVKSSIFVGEPIVYTLTITNNGPETATAATASLTLPPEAPFASVSPPVTCSGSLPVSCSAGTLSAGQKIVLTVSTPPATTTGTFAASATVSSSTPDSNTANNSASATVQVQEREIADLALRMTGPAFFIAGREASYTITLSNESAFAANDAAFAFAAPASTSLVSLVKTDGSTPFTCTGASCRTAALAPFATATFLAVVNVTSTATTGFVLTAAATATTTTTETDSTNNLASAAATVRDAFVDIAVTMEPLPPVLAVGVPAAFRIIVKNVGFLNVADVLVTDTLPATMTLSSAAPSQGSCDGAVCHTGALAAGATAEIIVVALPPLSTGSLTNRVSIVAAGDADPSNDTASANVIVGILRRRVAR